MSEESKDLITLDRRGDLSPRVALLFSMMVRTRGRLLRVVEDLTDREIDYSPDMKNIETIGTLLLHIAAVEWSWIFEDIDGEEMDYEKWKHAFALREDIPQLTKQGLQFYIDRLLGVRSDVFARLRNLDDSKLHKLVDVGSAEVSIEWILFHLLEHEALHIGQISLLSRLAKTSEN
ncbi:MAG: DinB family protein [Candidatus Thorarchaeota archaeon]